MKTNDEHVDFTIGKLFLWALSRFKLFHDLKLESLRFADSLIYFVEMVFTIRVH